MEYVFTHNGTLDHSTSKSSEFQPLRSTDSERAFCYLLECIEKNIDGDQLNIGDFNWLSGLLQEINRYGKFNCIFSDGKHLFCYHDQKGYRGLYFLERKPPYDRVRLRDEDWEINLAQEKNPKQQGYIIATQPLTDENWQNFEPGELIVFRDGEMVYSNRRSKQT